MKRRLGLDRDSFQFKPVKCNFSPCITVDANRETCSITRDGQLEMNGVKETRLDKPIKIATSSDDSHFAVDNEDKLWTWGKNDEGQLGHGDNIGRETPKLVLAL